MTEKTITICGKEVRMLYCAAAETGYEGLASGKSSSVFSPTVTKRDADGKPVKIEPPQAVLDDWLKLALAAIVAAYAKDGQDSPVTAEDILYNAGPQEITDLVSTIVNLRIEWYGLPAVIKTDEQPADDESPKNA